MRKRTKEEQDQKYYQMMLDSYKSGGSFSYVLAHSKRVADDYLGKYGSEHTVFSCRNCGTMIFPEDENCTGCGGSR